MTAVELPFGSVCDVNRPLWLWPGCVREAQRGRVSCGPVAVAIHKTNGVRGPYALVSAAHEGIRFISLTALWRAGAVRRGAREVRGRARRAGDTHTRVCRVGSPRGQPTRVKFDTRGGVPQDSGTAQRAEDRRPDRMPMPGPHRGRGKLFPRHLWGATVSHTRAALRYVFVRPRTRAPCRAGAGFRASRVARVFVCAVARARVAPAEPEAPPRTVWGVLGTHSVSRCVVCRERVTSVESRSNIREHCFCDNAHVYALHT